MRCKGFLFDLDGTLVDSLPAVERAWSNWADVMGYRRKRCWLSFTVNRRSPLCAILWRQIQADIAAEFTRLEHIEATETEGITALPGQSPYSII